MPYLYLFDPFTGYLRGRHEATLLGVRVDSSVAVRVSDHTAMPSFPLFLSSFLVEKKDSILRAFPAYTHILGEEFEFSPFAANNSDSISCKAGTKEIGIELNGRYVSTPYTLPYAPSQAMLIFEAYDEIVVDTPTGTVSRNHVRLPDNTTDVEARVDFTGAIPATLVDNTVPFVVGVPGTNFRVRFDNVNPGGLHFIGAWYLLYRA